MSPYVGEMYKSSYKLNVLNHITNNIKIQMQQWPSIKDASATGIKPTMELEPNIEYKLGLTNVNGNKTHSIQMHGLYVWLLSLDYIQIKDMGHFYVPVCLYYWNT